MQEDKSSLLAENLLGLSKDQYGDSYSEHVLKIYGTYLEMADRISSRRERANSFFLTLNTAVVGFVGYLAAAAKLLPNDPWLSLIAVAGIILSYLWYRIIRSYRGLNSAKFRVVHEMEKLLPLRPYDAEWEYVGRGKDPSVYLPFTHVEITIPWIFLALHIIVLLKLIPWAWYTS